MDFLTPLLLGLDWMDPEWWLDRFGQQMFWAAVAIVFSVIRVSPVQSAIGAGLMVAGVPAFYFWRNRLPPPGSRLPS